MKKTQSKDTIGKIILSILLLFLGEGLFGFSLYWAVLLSLTMKSKNRYWFGVIFGILVSSVTKTGLGIASLMIVLTVFIFDRIRNQIGVSPLMVIVFVGGVNLLADWVMGLRFGWLELTAGGLVTALVYKLDFFNDDLHLSNR